MLITSLHIVKARLTTMCRLAEGMIELHPHHDLSTLISITILWVDSTGIELSTLRNIVETRSNEEQIILLDLSSTHLTHSAVVRWYEVLRHMRESLFEAATQALRKVVIMAHDQPPENLVRKGERLHLHHSIMWEEIICELNLPKLSQLKILILRNQKLLSITRKGWWV